MKRYLSLVSRILLTTFVVGSSIVAGGSTSVFAAQVSAQADYRNHELKDSIEYVVKNRLMWLYSDGSFQPDRQVTQADLVASLVSLQQLQMGVAVPELPQGFWANVYYERAKAAGMLEGIIINPSKQLTREEFSQIVINTWGKYRKGYRSTRYPYKVQMIVDGGLLPARNGVFPNGVSTTLYDGVTGVTRAEQAAALQYLHIDYLEMSQGESIAAEFDRSLKVSGEQITGVVPTYPGIYTRVFIVTKDGKATSYEKGRFRLNAADINYLEISIKKSGSARPMALYTYTDFPNYRKSSSR